MERKLKRPRDPVQLAKLIGDIATGQIEDKTEDGKNPAAVAKGRKGGLKGGASRMATMTEDEKRQLAKQAAQSRWLKKAPAKSSGAPGQRSVKQR
jgi:hypothetical protein